MHYCMACLKGCCPADNAPGTPPRDLSLVRGAVITSRRFCGNCTGCPCDNESNSRPRPLSWSSSVYPAIHRRIWQTTVSSSARPTRRCVLFDGHFGDRFFATAGPRLWNHYLLRYDNVTVSGSSNGCWRYPVSGTAALCDILVKKERRLEIILLTYFSWDCVLSVIHFRTAAGASCG